VIRLTETARGEISTFEQQYIAAVAPAFDPVSTADLRTIDRILSSVRLPVERAAAAAPDKAGDALAG
jgi:hypothetical protein